MWVDIRCQSNQTKNKINRALKFSFKLGILSHDNMDTNWWTSHCTLIYLTEDWLWSNKEFDLESSKERSIVDVNRILGIFRSTVVHCEKEEIMEKREVLHECWKGWNLTCIREEFLFKFWDLWQEEAVNYSSTSCHCWKVALESGGEVLLSAWWGGGTHAIFRGRRVLLKKKKTTGKTPQWVLICDCREESAGDVRTEV